MHQGSRRVAQVLGKSVQALLEQLSPKLAKGVGVVWPHVPLAGFLILSGGANLFAGLRAEALVGVLPELSSEFPELGEQASLGALGGGVQAALGSALVLVGVGLLWRWRVAWTFALLLLSITMGVGLMRGEYGVPLVLPAFVFAALLASHRHFSRSTLVGSSIVSLISIFAVLAYGTFGSFLLGDGFNPPIRNVMTGLYFTIVTMSTVGYGDILPSSPATQGFVISLVVVGLSIFATAVVSLLGPAMSGQLHRFLSAPGKVMKPRDHVILAGDGTIARNIAHEMLRRGIEMVQIVHEGADPPLPDLPLVRGDAGEDSALQEAGIDRARMIVAAERDDGNNAFISLAAKDINPAVRVLAVANTLQSIRRLKRAGADLVFAPAAVGSRLLVDLVQDKEIPPEYFDWPD
jgi:voltage-gated potassium channel